MESLHDETLLKYYKSLLIINDMYNTSWANLMIPGIKLLFLGAVISAFYGTIRFSGSIEIMIYIWCPMLVIFVGGIFVLLPPLLASVHELSIQIIGKREMKIGKREHCFLFLSSVSNGGNSLPFKIRIMNREWIACRPMMCGAGSFYYFDRNTGLTCLNLIVQITAYFLVLG